MRAFRAIPGSGPVHVRPRPRGFVALERRFASTAARIKACNASASGTTPSRISMARRVFPSRLALNSPPGSGKAAPRAKVS